MVIFTAEPPTITKYRTDLLSYHVFNNYCCQPISWYASQKCVARWHNYETDTIFPFPANIHFINTSQTKFSMNFQCH